MQTFGDNTRKHTHTQEYTPKNYEKLQNYDTIAQYVVCSVYLAEIESSNIAQ